jgi:hypothetical protein
MKMIKSIIFSNKISDKNRDFTLFKSKNTLKLIALKFSLARKIVDPAPVADDWFTINRSLVF